MKLFNWFSKHEPEVLHVTQTPALPEGRISRPSHALAARGIYVPDVAAPMQEHIAFCQKHLTFAGLLLKLNTRVVYEPAANYVDGIMIKVIADTLCIVSGKPEFVTGFKLVVPSTFTASPMIDQVFEAARCVMLHELAEGFGFDGKPAIDPHEHKAVEL